MVMYQQEHDEDEKTLLGGTVIPAGTDGNADIAAALDNLFNHSNVAPFIAYRLIQRLVKSNPSRGYIRRVAQAFEDDGNGVRGDLGAVVKAVLLDAEAWRSVRIRRRRSPDRVEVSGRGTEYSRLREPTLRYVHLFRASHAQPNVDVDGNPANGAGYFMMRPRDYVWGQGPYRAPSVFNFWLPSYQPPGDLIGYQPSRRIPNGNLVAPEFQLKTAVTSNYLIQQYIWEIWGARSSVWFNAADGGTQYIDFDYSAEATLVGGYLGDGETDSDHDGLVAYLNQLDLVHCCGTMPQDFKDLVVSTIESEAYITSDARVKAATIAVLMSPFCAISE